jgi:hypothetical protein
MVSPPPGRLSGRGPLIAGQAAIVAVLIAIVYFTLLQPNDSNTPSGIEAGPPSARNDSDANGGDGVGGADRGDGSGGADTGGTQGGAGGAPGVAGASLANAAGGSRPSPAGDQYFDSLAVLKQQLGIAATLSTEKRLKRR